MEETTNTAPETETNETPQVEDSAVEAASAEKPPETQEEKPNPLAKQFSALTREQKKLREQKAALKAREEKVTAYEKAVAQAKEDPLAFLQSIGLSYDDVFDAAIGIKKKEDPAAKALAEVEKLRAEAEREKLEAKLAHNRAQIEAAQRHIEKEVLNSEKYELLTAQHEAGTLDVKKEIFAYIQGYYEQNGVEVTIEQAADALETYLEETTERLLKTKKVQKKVGQPQTQDAETVSSAQTKTENGRRDKTGPKTLTNSLSAAAPAKSGGEKLSYEDRKKAAYALLNRRS